MSIREILNEYALSEDNEYGNGDYTIDHALLAIKQEVKKVIPTKEVENKLSDNATFSDALEYMKQSGYNLCLLDVLSALDKLFDEVMP